MKAIVCTKYGSADVLELQDVAMPVPKHKEIRVKVHATTVTSGDCRVRAFNSPLLYWLPMRLVLGIRKPRRAILGVELSGEVDAIGAHVTRFKKGDPIFAFAGMKFGAYAEYICLPEDGLIAAKPAQATYEEAASVLFGGTSALYFLRKGNIRNGQKVLIYGASGAVGSSAVQLAKCFGAEVTGVCSTTNLELVKTLGADHVIDYTKEDFADREEKYDIIFDAVGKRSKADCKKALNATGKFVTVDGQGIARECLEDVIILKEWMEAGKLKAVIDRCYPMEQIRDAHTYVEKGHKKGNVVITMGIKHGG